jgi:hypothetical protein
MGKLLNDPFEGQIIGDKHIQNLFQNAGVLSLSRVNDNLLMWSHYGNSHNGLCYGFDKNILIESIWKDVEPSGETFFDHGDVLYTNAPPNVIGEKLEDYNAKDIIFHKSTGWAYEQEYRIVLAGQREAGYSITALKSVIIGAHVPLFYPEYSKLWDALAALPKEVMISKFELNQNSFGLIAKTAWSHGSFEEEWAKRRGK